MIRYCWALVATALLPAVMGSGQGVAADIAGLRQLYDGAMLPGVEVATFSQTERLLPVRVVHRGDSARPIPRSATPFPAIHFKDHGHAYDLYDYVASNRVAGILVIKDGAIALEDYELGTGPDTHWASFSMAKSMTSTLIGAALVDGLISSLDDPVILYVPSLRGSAYDGVSVRQVLTMSSGVRWNEAYLDPKSDRRKVLDLQIAGKPGEILHYMASLPRAAKPGSVWNYSTGETFVLGAIVEGAVHRPLADYLSDKIWSPAGMEQDATWWIDGPDGLGWAGSGIGATLRDYGRFGLIAANRGRVNGRALVPEDWFDEAGVPQVIGKKTVDYGYMWWIPPQTVAVHSGAFEAVGIFGQYTYINPREHLVIVVLSARSKPEPEFALDDDAFFAAVATALH
jgi:CubicO group peptidase (beta-lactamase class C family)